MTNAKYEIITIARWLKSLKLPPDFKKVGKSELMLRLSSAFKNYFPNSDGNLFYNAFEIFTELRSFSIDPQILFQVINELSDEIGMAIKVFMATMDSLNLIDEHFCYQEMKNLENSRPILFLGFKHFSSVQIDMIKSISNKSEVYIFIPSYVKANAISTDWVNWIDTQEIKQQDIRIEKNIDVVFYPPKKLNLYLSSFLDQTKKSPMLALMGSGEELLKDQEILLHPYGLKESIDLFQIDRDLVFDQVLELDFKSIDQLIDYLQSNEKETIAKGEYRKTKIIQIFIEGLKVYSEYHSEYDRFVHNLMAEVVTLNSPRNFIVNLQDSNVKKLKLDEIKYQSTLNEIILIFNKENSPFKNSLSKYSEEVQNILKTIGPIRRKGLDILFLKHELHTLIQSQNIILFLEDGMVDVDPGVRELKKNFGFNPIEINFERKEKQKKDYLKKKHLINDLKTYSASKLQVFYDCPRKYYISYLDKIDDQPVSKIGINPDELGNLEHSIVEEYSKKYSILNLEEIKKLCKYHLDNYISSNNLLIPLDEYNEVYFELVDFTRNGIDFVLKIKSENPNGRFEFEFPLPNNMFQMKGFIDFIVFNEDSIQIYDFKRSSASIGNRKELVNFEKLQLWIYAFCMSEKYRCTKIGYVNFSDQDGHLIISITNELEVFREKLSVLIEKYNNEVEFHPEPRKEDVCRYCSFQKLCFKEVI